MGRLASRNVYVRLSTYLGPGRARASGDDDVARLEFDAASGPTDADGYDVLAVSFGWKEKRERDEVRTAVKN